MEWNLILFLFQNDETINYSRSICTENIIFSMTNSGIAINCVHINMFIKWLNGYFMRSKNWKEWLILHLVDDQSFPFREKRTLMDSSVSNSLSFKNGEKLQKMQKIFFGAFIYALILASNTRKGLLLLERKWHLKFWTTFWVWR